MAPLPPATSSRRHHSGPATPLEAGLPQTPVHAHVPIRHTIGFAGGLNLYQYGNSNPTNYVDPSGLMPTPLQRLGPVRPEAYLSGGLGQGHSNLLNPNLDPAFRVPGWPTVPSLPDAQLPPIGIGGDYPIPGLPQVSPPYNTGLGFKFGSLHSNSQPCPQGWSRIPAQRRKFRREHPFLNAGKTGLEVVGIGVGVATIYFAEVAFAAGAALAAGPAALIIGLLVGIAALEWGLNVAWSREPSPAPFPSSSTARPGRAGH